MQDIFYMEIFSTNFTRIFEWIVVTLQFSSKNRLEKYIKSNRYMYYKSML